MDRWEPALRKNKSAFSVLGWGRANCDGPYVLTQPQERRGRIGMSSILHPAHLRPSWGQLSSTGMSCWRCVPSRANRDTHLLQRVALEHEPCRALQGEFHSPPGKAVGLVFEISWVAGQRREDCVSGGGEEENRASLEQQCPGTPQRWELCWWQTYAGFHPLASLPARIFRVYQNS